jgi:catechol 2,3-dioxygenase
MPSTPAAQLQPTDALLWPGAVTLIVRDLEGVGRYYEEVIGLHRMGTEHGTVQLGNGRAALLTLRRRDVDPEPPGSAGLFHTAFLMPTRADLGRWLRRALRSGVRLDGASDHKVSEALYLTDPEGNGIEVYADRPRDAWLWKDGKVLMTTDPLDVEGLIAASEGDTSDAARVPSGTTVGHIHLRVGGLAEAEAFYRDVLGLDITCRYPGATFYSTGGYHHHFATNIWRSRNAPKRSGSTTGLASFELIARDRDAFDASAERLIAGGGWRTGDAIEAADPWGNIVLLKQAGANS